MPKILFDLYYLIVMVHHNLLIYRNKNVEIHKRYSRVSCWVVTTNKEIAESPAVVHGNISILHRFKQRYVAYIDKIV